MFFYEYHENDDVDDGDDGYDGGTVPEEEVEWNDDCNDHEDTAASTFVVDDDGAELPVVLLDDDVVKPVCKELESAELFLEYVVCVVYVIGQGVRPEGAAKARASMKPTVRSYEQKAPDVVFSLFLPHPKRTRASDGRNFETPNAMLSLSAGQSANGRPEKRQHKVGGRRRVATSSCFVGVFFVGGQHRGSSPPTMVWPPSVFFTRFGEHDDEECG